MGAEESVEDRTNTDEPVGNELENHRLNPEQRRQALFQLLQNEEFRCLYWIQRIKFPTKRDTRFRQN